MTKRLLSLSLAIIIGLLCLTGCGENVATRNTVTNISFSWWGNDNRHNYTMDAVDIFQNTNDDISVGYRYGEWSGYERRNRVWMESHTDADVMQINYGWLNVYSEDGLGYYDLSTLSDYIDLSGYDEDDLKYGMVNGHLNAIPIAFNKSTLCFNKDIFDEYGLDYPKTWTELFDVAKVLREHDIYVLGMAKKHLLLMLIAYYEQTTGQHVFDEEGNLLIDEEGVGYMLDFYKLLLDEEVIIPLEQFDRTLFSDGVIAGSIFWISDADNYCAGSENSGFTPEFCDYFMDENAVLSGLYMKPATMYAISANTDHPEAAGRLLNYLLNDENMALLQGTEKGVPVSEYAIDVLMENGMLDTFGYAAYENMQNNKDILNVMIPNMESEAILDAFKQGADAYIYGVQDRDTTAAMIYSDIQDVIKGL